MRFQLLDHVEQVDDTALTGHKSVTLAEEYLGDHFPGYPVLPGVMMLETLVQAARHWLEQRPDADMGVRWVLAEARNVRYGHMVRPGQTMEVQITSRGQRDNRWEFQGTGRVGDRTTVQARFRLMPVAASTSSD